MSNKRHLDVSVYIEQVTPARAKELLASGENPRGKSSPRIVAAYVRMMLAGLWKVGAPIMLDEKQALMDGFTRCAAVVQANKTIAFLVIDGVPRDVADTLDNGQPRPKDSALAVCGVRQYAKMMASLIINIVKMPFRNVVVKNADMKPLYELYQTTLEWAVGIFGGKAQGIVKIAVVSAFARAHLAGADAAALTALAHNYIGQTWEPKSPLRLLSLYIANNPKAGGSDLYLRAARAVQACLAGETLGCLKAGDDPFPCDSPL